MKNKISLFIIITSFMLLFGTEACKKAGQTPHVPKFLSLPIPTAWPTPERNIFINNPPTEEGFQLGKRLFYEGRLSKDGNFPCASCHQPRAAFGTYNHDLSHGYGNSHTRRNAPGLFNLAWQKEMNWNGSLADIENRAYLHIDDPFEMGGSMGDVVARLRQDAEYRQLFAAAFGSRYISSDITSDRIVKAIAQFTGMMLSDNTKYDRVMRGEATFTTAEQNGYNIFKSRCNNCHKEPMFTDYSYRNNGFAIDSVQMDFGRMEVTLNPADSLKFKVPTLRNTGFTFPYLHDGRLTSLASMIDHYSLRVIVSPTVDTSLLNIPPFTNAEKFQLLQFLATLDDSSFLVNPRYVP